MSVYDWPAAWQVTHFEMRIAPNTRTFVGPYTPSTQVVDLLGERWKFVVHLAPTTSIEEGAAREAFFDRLKGPAHQIRIWHRKRPAPLGTMRGAPTLSAAAAQLANVISISGTGTLKAGDHLGIAGQLVRVMADATLPGAVEIQPRLRQAVTSGTAVIWDKPTCNVMLTADGVPVGWSPGVVEASSFEAIEVW